MIKENNTERQTVRYPDYVSIEMTTFTNEWGQQIPGIKVYEWGNPRFALTTPDMWKILEHIYNGGWKE